VIVLDHDLSGVHGDTLCRMPTDDDPAMILMLTAANAPTQASRGPRSVPTTTLQTVALPELVLHVRAPGRRKPTPKRSALRAAGIELDREQRAAALGRSPAITLLRPEAAHTTLLIGRVSANSRCRASSPVPDGGCSPARVDKASTVKVWIVPRESGCLYMCELRESPGSGDA
jgi:hypothetical protein